MGKGSNYLINLICLAGITLTANAAEVTVTMHKISDKGVGDSIGTIKLADSDKGLVVTPDLKNLTTGPHGFHVHQNPDCAAKEKDGKLVAGLAAGGHFDPTQTAKHEGPHGHGHMGDLPVLDVTADGKVTKAMTVARLKVEQLKGRALMIHDGGDNYSDTPKPLGGGGARVACGVIN